MSSLPRIIDTLPEAWARDYKPFLLRAQEFESGKHELIKYFLVSYVAHRAMIAHKGTSKEQREAQGLTKYLFAVVDYLEALKAAEPLSTTLSESDGRTAVTKMAIQMFTMADDLEREGHVSEKVLKLFYTSSLLFEATRQFVDDDEMDPIASQKHKYAQVVALKMKKALVSGTPYVSPNEHSAVAPHPDTPTMPADCKPSISENGVGVTNDYGHALPSQPPSFAHQPPPSAPQPLPSAPQPLPQYPQHQQLPTYSGVQLPSSQPVQSPVSPPPSTGAYVPPGPAGKVDHNRIIDAQKYAKQAVSALQFYDQDNARKQLNLALQTLDGTI